MLFIRLALPVPPSLARSLPTFRCRGERGVLSSPAGRWPLCSRQAVVPLAFRPPHPGRNAGPESPHGKHTQAGLCGQAPSPSCSGKETSASITNGCEEGEAQRPREGHGQVKVDGFLEVGAHFRRKGVSAVGSYLNPQLRRRLLGGGCPLGAFLASSPALSLLSPRGSPSEGTVLAASGCSRHYMPIHYLNQLSAFESIQILCGQACSGSQISPAF